MKLVSLLVSKRTSKPSLIPIIEKALVSNIPSVANAIKWKTDDEFKG